MEHPLIGKLDDFTAEELLTKITELNRKLTIAMRMGNAVKKKPRKSDRFWRALGMDGVE